MSRDTFWTQNRVIVLRELTEKGLSAEQIACILGAVSRSAVIGKWHRLGIQPGKNKCVAPKPVPVEPRKRPPSSWMKRVKQMDEPAKLLPPTKPEHGVHLLELTGCKWPINNAKKNELHLFCNDQKETGQPYCAAHCEKAYTSVKGYRSKSRTEQKALLLHDWR